MWGSSTTWTQLRGSINRLAELNQVPEGPKENVLHLRHSTRRLGLARENEIVNNLAFLSATSDNSLKVMAVCLEEHVNGTGITIRIASNTGDLGECKSGFETLASSLEQAARRENSRDTDKEALFRKVVAMDRNRILSRLRSRHARSYKTVGRQPIIAQLNEALYDKGVKARPGFEKTSLKAIRAKARALQVLFNKLEGISDPSLERIDVEETIGHIVKEAHEISKAAGISTALQTFSGDPSLKQHLPEAIGKLGRYYSASSELVYAARDKTCRVFESIQVEPCEILVPNTIQEAKDYKVHAEIQLLFFYELRPDILQPRVICSSKSACYLCNLFFGLHNSIDVPRTHGKLYTKWILPDWLDIPTNRRKEFGLIAAQLKATLDNKIQFTQRSRKSVCYHPNESILQADAHWSSSSASSAPQLLASTSTLRPSCKPVQDTSPELSLGIDLPFTPPTTVPDRCASASRELETTRASTGVEHTEDVGSITTLDDRSLISIGSDQLPYSHSIMLSTPSLHLQLNKLSLTLDFVQVTSGHLAIKRVSDSSTKGKCYSFDVADIPTTTTGLRMHCPLGANELSFQLLSPQKEVFCIIFTW